MRAFLLPLLLPFLLIPVFVKGQNKHRVDSLNALLSTTQDDKVRVSALNTLTLEYIRTDIAKAQEYNTRALALAEKTGDKHDLADAWLVKSGIYKFNGDYDKALEATARAIGIYRETGDTVAYADCLSESGTLYSLKNDLKNALINLLEAEKLYKLTGSIKNLSKLFNGMGSLYQGQQQFDKALEYYNKSLEINNKTGFVLGSSVNLMNIGNAYKGMKDYKKAIEFTEQALKLKETIHDVQGIEKCLNNLGTCYANTGNPVKAITYHERALSCATSLKNKVDIAMSYVNLGFDYQEAGKPDNAVFYSLKGYSLSKEIGNLKFMTEATRVLAGSYATLGNYRQAYEYFTLHKQHNDSLEKEKNLKAVHEIQAKYDMAVKENEIKALKITRSQQELKLGSLRTKYYLFFSLFLFVSLLVVFFFYRSRTSKKLNLKLKEISDMKSHFFANLSHEFRTPLTLMLGPTEKLMEKAGPDDLPWLELIHRNATRLLTLDEQLLEFTRIDSGNQKISLVSGDIVQIARVIGSAFELLAEKRQIEYSQSYPDEKIPAWVDPDILEKVLGNLLTNAFKYTPAGRSVHFSVERFTETPPKHQERKGNGANGEFIRFVVSDTGIGIPESKKDKIFDRFYQLTLSEGNPYVGAGIGLALTRELLTLHHGSVTVESAEGKGSVFTVLLPLSDKVYSKDEFSGAAQQETTEREKTVRVSTGSSGSPDPGTPPGEHKDGRTGHEPSKILIVDDNADMRVYVRDILCNQYQVMESGGGETGFQEAVTLIPDLIVTDIMMEDMDGIQLCDMLKKDERTSHIPVIMLTALSDSADRIRGLETGADDYIPKPFSSQELLVRIRNLITQRESLRRLFTNEFRIEPTAVPVNSVDKRFLQKLISCIEKNIDNSEFDVNFLVEDVGMSRSQLHRKITALTGQPITGFIRLIRMKRAAHLMENRAGNISDIMYAVGFDNQSYFSKCFRDVYGVTPRDYMLKNGSPQEITDPEKADPIF